MSMISEQQVKADDMEIEKIINNIQNTLFPKRNCGIDCLYWNHGCVLHNTVPGGCKDFKAVRE